MILNDDLKWSWMILNNLNWSKIPRYISKYPNRCPGAPVFPPQETKDATKPVVDFAIDPAAPLKIEEESTTVSWRLVAFAKWFWGVPFGITVDIGYMDLWMMNGLLNLIIWMIYGWFMDHLWMVDGVWMGFLWIVDAIPDIAHFDGW